MSTPEVSGSHSIKSKYSPFCNGISKSLLTPCRQIGLSRKRKTPVGSFSKYSSEDLNLSNNTSTSIKSTNSGPENETTPVVHTKLFNRRKKSENLLSAFNNSIIISSGADTITENKLNTDSEELRNCAAKKPKIELRQTFTSEDLFDSNDDIPCSLKNKTNTEYASDTEFFKAIKHDEDQNTTEYKDRNRLEKKVVRQLTNDFVLNKSVNHTTTGSDSDDDFVVSKCSKNIIKTMKNRDSKPLKKAPFERKVSLDSDNLNKNTCTKDFKIQLQKLSENNAAIDCVVRSRDDETTVTKTLTKKSSSNVIDDADFFTSTPEEEKLKRKNIEKKMRVLESEVKQKRTILENLQRASIYKSKHNVPDLKQLTSVWVDGCVLALKDLLTQLQAHGSIDLNTLLNNMNIPKDIVRKLPLNTI